MFCKMLSLQVFVFIFCFSTLVAYNQKSPGSNAGTKIINLQTYDGGSVTRSVSAAIKTDHRVEYYDVPNEGSVEPTTIEVDSTALPMTILFKTRSSSLDVLHQHDGQTGSTQETSSEDEPHLLKHTVSKPIVQELYEIISPVRKIVQEILPVQEEIQTIVARAVGSKSTNAGLGGSFGIVGQNLAKAIKTNQIKTFPVLAKEALPPFDVVHSNNEAVQQTSDDGLIKITSSKSSSPKGTKIDQKQTY